jgi:hypothetical protein
MSLNFRTILREPLLHFLALAALLFVAARYWGDNDNSRRYRITVTPEVVSRLAEGYYRQYGGVPSDEQLRRLADQYVREEILYREAVALGLDREDEIIRRRIVQKMEFLQQDLTVIPEPTDAELVEYYNAHPDRYQIPERRSFTQVYFSPDREGDTRAKARALEVLASLRSGRVTRAPERGDAFPGLSDYSSLGSTEVARVFGESEFSSALFSAPVAQWSGPYRSGFGWHLLYVQATEPPSLPPLAQVRDSVRADYIEQLRASKNAEVYARLSAKYNVVRPEVMPSVAQRHAPSTAAAGPTGTD